MPAAVPGIVFLSGGQSDELATAHLDAMNRLEPQPWQLSFSYGRALQAPALKAWKGDTANVAAAKMALYHRAKLNGAARFGRYSEEMEPRAGGKRASMTRIGVLTGGGDVPGLNPCIKTLVYGAVERGYEVVGLRAVGPACSTTTSTLPSRRPLRPTTHQGRRAHRRPHRRDGPAHQPHQPGKVKPKDVPEFLKGQGQGESDGPSTSPPIAWR